MIFKAIKLYRMTKKGVKDPTGLVVEEIQDAYLGIVLVPTIILVVILVLLGLMGFSDLIVRASVIARIFFWILFVGGIIWGAIVISIGKFISKILQKGKTLVVSQQENVK